MRNWYEMDAFSHETVSDLTRFSRSVRMKQESRRLSRAAAAQGAGSAAAAGGSSAAATTVVGACPTFVLQRGEVISIRARRRPYRVSCIAGRLWTTVGGSPMDTVLAAGQSVTCRERGRIVIQALRTATVRIQCKSPARVVVGAPLRPVFQVG